MQDMETRLRKEFQVDIQNLEKRLQIERKLKDSEQKFMEMIKNSEENLKQKMDSLINKNSSDLKKIRDGLHESIQHQFHNLENDIKDNFTKLKEEEIPKSCEEIMKSFRHVITTHATTDTIHILKSNLLALVSSWCLKEEQTEEVQELLVMDDSLVVSMQFLNHCSYLCN
jgi:DNA anti-recombination protein RmuC